MCPQYSGGNYGDGGRSAFGARKGGGSISGDWARWIVLLIVAGIVLSTLGCVEKLGEKDGKPAGNVESFFKNVNMSINPGPVLNQPVDIAVTVSSPSVNVSNITLELFIPVGFELISDNSKWRGDMQKGETRNLKVKVRAIHAGNWAIQFLATADLPSGSTFLDTKFLYVSISETEAKVSDIPMIGINYIGTAQKESLKTTNEELLN